MAVGDGSAWDETNPTNSTLATSIDDYDRDLRLGVRSRMALEHEWPSSQSATNQAGQHKFITLQNQAAKPTVSGTQLASVYTKTVGAGLQELFYENEAGTEVQVTSRTVLMGAILQMVNTSTVAPITINSTMPYLAQPTTAQGVLVMSKAITPLSATSNLEIEVLITGGAAPSILGIGAMFQDTTSGAIACGVMNPRDNLGQIAIKKVLSSPGTTAVTFYLRCGTAGGSGNFYVNADSAGSSIFGSNASTYLIIREYK